MEGSEGFRISSRNSERIEHVLKQPEWDGSLLMFVENFKRLKELEPKKVNLPDVERVSP